MAENPSNETIIDAVTTTNDIVNSLQTITAQGAGKAYQSVAHSSSISIQDGIDYLRNVSTIATAGIGVATAKLISTKDPQYAEIIGQLQGVVKDAAEITKTIGMNAGNVLSNFPIGK
jgi:hypothetical protein